MQPLAQFEIKKILSLMVMTTDISITNCSVLMIATGSLIAILFFVGLRKCLVIPGRLQSLCEMIFEIVGGILHDTTGIHGKQYVSLMASLFTFILGGNLFGMIPYSFTFTSQFAINFALGLIVIFFITIVGIIRQGAGFLHVFCPQGIPLWVAPLLIPVEIISYIARPISLSIRLTANMIAGHSMLKVFAYFAGMAGFFCFAPICVSMALIAFEFLVAFLQAYVFTMLSCIYLRDALETH